MIRKANIDDLDVIASYNINLAKETEDYDLNKKTVLKGVEAILNDESKGSYFVYEVNQKVVGQIMFTREWSDWRNGDFLWIQSVYVNKDYRRQGIFKALYKHVETIANNHPSVCGLRLYVEKDNHQAKKTYASLGMKETHYLLYEWKK